MPATVSASHAHHCSQVVHVLMQSPKPSGGPSKPARPAHHCSQALHVLMQSPKPSGGPSKPSKVQFSQEPQSPSPRGIRSVSLFAPDSRSARGTGSSNLSSTQLLQQGSSSSAQASDDLSGIHARAYMADQQSRRGTSFVDASGSAYNFKGVPGTK